MNRLADIVTRCTRLGLGMFAAWTLLAGSPLKAGSPETSTPKKQSAPAPQVEPFWGEHQGGIVTWPIQHQSCFAAFDVVTTKREDLIKLMQAWTAASARMATGETAQPLEGGLKLAVPPPPSEVTIDLPDAGPEPADTGEAIGMSPSRLTITFGFGVTLFIKDGKDRFGLAAQRPAALVDMPKFVGDQLIESRTGGDISVQACAEDLQVAFHAIRQLARMGEGVIQLRWMQNGFRPNSGARHLLGFSVEGMPNPSVSDAKVMAATVWSGSEGPDWMRGGSYVVARRMRFALEHWDHMKTKYQEEAVGGAKYHGDPMVNPHHAVGQKAPAEDLDAAGDQHPSHLDIVMPHAFTMFRRSYSYIDGANFTTERWPPWRQGLEYDAGMLFICYQRDPRTGFIKLNDMMAKNDFKLNQFWTHEGSGLFACPPGVRPGGYIGQALFESK